MSINNLTITKSVLAKLLAGENINVVHVKTKTASFDLKTRVLRLPIWEVMDGDLYDLLLGHETGHALFTPPQGWFDTIKNHGRGIKDAMNVVEDARIEKLIKRKYPGLARPFSTAYRDLYNRDFFAVRGLKDFSKLNIIDRINLYFKLGAHLIVPFTDEEREFVRGVSNAETWDQVVELARQIYKHAQEEPDSIKNAEELSRELNRMFDDDDDEYEDAPERDDSSEDFDQSSEDYRKISVVDDESDDSSDDSDQSSEDSSEDSDDSDQSSEDSSEGSDDSDQSSEDSSEGSDDSDQSSEDSSEGSSEDSDDSDQSSEDSYDFDVESVTARSFSEREKELVTENVEIHQFTFPEPILENIIISNDILVKYFNKHITTINHENLPIGRNSVSKFMGRNKSYINMLVKEFNMRKDASQYARTTVACSGELDMSKLHKYKYTNDIFRKISVVGKGKNHGMVLFLDMSGSMGNIFASTVEQVLILSVFCKKVGIPFDVYGFGDTSNDDMIDEKFLSESFRFYQNREVLINTERFNTYGEDITIKQAFSIKHLLSSSLDSGRYRKAFEMLAIVAMCHGSYNLRRLGQLYSNMDISWKRCGFGLGGTPFVQTLMASRPILESFKAKHQVDITNVIYLTDGEGDRDTMKFHDCRGSGAMKIILTDRKTKKRLIFSSYNQQALMTKFIRELTGCKHIGYYLFNKNMVRFIFRNIDRDINNSTKCFDPNSARMSLSKSGYFSHSAFGYDNYYFVLAEKTDTENEQLNINSDMTVRKMVKVFSEAQNTKKKNRYLISKFAEDIAL